ncbi:5792_t:CDS:1, partial [Scutellospora calospora]
MNYYPSVQDEDDYEIEEVVASGQIRLHSEVEEDERVIGNRIRLQPDVESEVVEREIKRPRIEREILFKSIVLEKNSSIDLIFNDINIKINRK